MSHVIWNIVGALVALGLALFVVLILIAHVVLLLKELKNSTRSRDE